MASVEHPSIKYRVSVNMQTLGEVQHGDEAEADVVMPMPDETDWRFLKEHGVEPRNPDR